jgi:hypothetical protein
LIKQLKQLPDELKLQRETFKNKIEYFQSCFYGPEESARGTVDERRKDLFMYTFCPAFFVFITDTLTSNPQANINLNTMINRYKQDLDLKAEIIPAASPNGFVHTDGVSRLLESLRGAESGNQYFDKDPGANVRGLNFKAMGVQTLILGQSMYDHASLAEETQQFSDGLLHEMLHAEANFENVQIESVQPLNNDEQYLNWMIFEAGHDLYVDNLPEQGKLLTEKATEIAWKHMAEEIAEYSKKDLLETGKDYSLRGQGAQSIIKTCRLLGIKPDETNRQIVTDQLKPLFKEAFERREDKTIYPEMRTRTRHALKLIQKQANF